MSSFTPPIKACAGSREVGVEEGGWIGAASNCNHGNKNECKTELHVVAWYESRFRLWITQIREMEYIFSAITLVWG